MKWKQYLQLILATLLVGFCIWIAVLILPALQRWMPVISNLAGLLVVVFLIVVMVSLVLMPLAIVHHFHSKNMIAQIEARKLNVTEKGYMQGYIAMKANDRLLVPAISMHSPDVPAHVHIQEDHSNKGGSAADWREALAREKLEWEREKFQLLNGQAEQKQLAAPKPKIEDIVQEIAANGLEVCIGKSLSTGEYLKTDLAGKHLKIIGATQMGKSCLVGAILEQLRLTHDLQHLRLAILDLEDFTGTLFEDDPHVLEVNVDGTPAKLHARNETEVARYLVVLHQIMQHRYTLIQQKGFAYVERQPRILIYFEEFLYWKKTLALQVKDSTLQEEAIAAINGLATRGLKVGMHLLIVAQVDYSDKELLAAMAQFVGLNVSFAVKPSAARSAGFVANDLLNKNFEKKQPGHYVVEMIGGADLGVSPDFDAKAKVKALLNARAGEEKTIIEGEVEELQPFPNSAIDDFQTQQWKRASLSQETAQEKAAGEIDTESQIDAFALKNFLADARKRRAEGTPLNTILKEYGLPSGGRMHQEVKELLDAINE